MLNQGWCPNCEKPIATLSYFCGICGSPNENAYVGLLTSSICEETTFHYQLAVMGRQFCTVCRTKLGEMEKEEKKIIDHLVESVDFSRPLWLCEVLFRADTKYLRLSDTDFLFRLADKASSEGISINNFLNDFNHQYAMTQRLMSVLISKKTMNSL